jgi:hypothetical protein
MLGALHWTAAVIHQLIEKVFRGLSPFLNDYGNGLFLFRRQGFPSRAKTSFA